MAILLDGHWSGAPFLINPRVGCSLTQPLDVYSCRYRLDTATEGRRDHPMNCHVLAVSATQPIATARSHPRCRPPNRAGSSPCRQARTPRRSLWRARARSPRRRAIIAPSAGSAVIMGTETATLSGIVLTNSDHDLATVDVAMGRLRLDDCEVSAHSTAAASNAGATSATDGSPGGRST
jgi:hypothetical protein